MTTNPNPNPEPRLANLVALRRESAAGFNVAYEAEDEDSIANFDRELNALDAAIAAETARQTGTGLSTYSSVFWNI